MSKETNDLFGEIIVDITDKMKAIIGEQVKYSAVGTLKNRSKSEDQLIEEIESGFVLNPDWNGDVCIMFNNGAEIVISGSDYVSVIIRKNHQND